MSISLASISGKSSQELLEEHSVQELELIKAALSTDVASKRKQLRDLVGGKYRDLLTAADDIVEMNSLATTENDQLVGITFRKAGYEGKTLKNTLAFHRRTLTERKKRSQETNRDRIFANAVHDCVYGYYQIGQTDKGTAQFVFLAKQFYLVFSLFAKKIDGSTSSPAQKVTQLRQKFLGDIQTRLVSTAEDYNYESVTNLLTAYVIVSQSTPTEALLWFLQIRKDNMAAYSVAEQFQGFLSYVYVTFNYLTNLQTRLPTVLTRQIYSAANSNWLAESTLVKWKAWLDVDFAHYAVDFPVSASQLKANVSQGMTSAIEDWETEVASTVYDSLTKAFSACDSANKLSSTLSQVLLNFKEFTSLVNLKLGDKKPLIEALITAWKKQYFAVLVSNLGQFNSISENVLAIFSDSDKLKESRTNYGLDLFRETDISDIDRFISEIAQPEINNTVMVPIRSQIDTFKQNVNEIVDSVKALSQVRTELKRPVLSSDDTKDPEFWEKTNNTIGQLVTDSTELSLEKLNGSIKQFFDTIEKSLGGEHTPAEYLYMIRVVLSFRKDELNSVYTSLTGLEDTQQALDIKELVSPILTKLLSPLVSLLSQDALNELEKRPSAEDAPEVNTWEEYPGTDKRVPGSPSILLEGILYKLTQSLLVVDGCDYSDVYLIEEFEPVKQKLLKQMIETVNSSGEHLLNYADSAFLACLSVSEATEESIKPLIPTKLEPEEDAKPDSKYESQALRQILAHYKATRLTYYPLS